MKIQKNVVKFIKSNSSESEDNVVQLPPEKLLSFVWDLTEEVFSLSGDYDVKSRLQRDVVNIIRPRG